MRWLDRIVSTLGAIRELAAYVRSRPLKEAQSAGDREGNPGHEGGAVTQYSVAVSVQIDPAVLNAHQSQEQQHDRRDKKRLWIEGITLAVLAVYGAITYGIYTSTERTLEETQRSNERTQRAYVVVPRVDLTRDSTRGKAQWGVRVDLENSGQSPATITAYDIRPWPAGPPTDPSQCPIYNVNQAIGVILGPRLKRAFYGGSPPGQPTPPNSITLDEGIAQSLSQRPEKRMPLTFYVFAQYADAFTKGQSKRHTRQCFYMLPYVDGGNADLYIYRDKPPARSAFGDCSYCNAWE